MYRLSSFGSTVFTAIFYQNFVFCSIQTRNAVEGHGVLAVVDEIVNKRLQSRFRKAISSGPKDVLTMQKYNKQTLALRQASEESACILLSFFCDD